MHLSFPIIPIAAIVSLLVFAYMRNQQARRNDKRRDRLDARQEELMEMLKAKKVKEENSNGNKTP